jgi:hypothetical protein
MVAAMTTPSVIQIAFRTRLDPATYAALVHGCWAVLVASGHASDATIHPDGSATDQQLNDALEHLIEESPWGW